MACVSIFVQTNVSHISPFNVLNCLQPCSLRLESEKSPGVQALHHCCLVGKQNPHVSMQLASKESSQVKLAMPLLGL